LKIPTRRFGTVEIQEEQVIYAPSGLIGFPHHKRYVLLEHRKGSPFVWFQSAEDESLAFVLIDPLLVKPDYEIQISSEDRKALELENSCEGLQAMAIVSISPGIPMEITANLLGPILINGKKRLAKQVVLYQSTYSTRTPLPTVKA